MELPAENELTLLPEMSFVLASLERDVAKAKKRIWIETYIYRDDVLGRTFADKLAAAVKRGVEVRLLYDALGSHETDTRFFDELRARGIDARAFRPLDVILRSGMWPRDHSRVVVIDDAGYSGGAAWGNEWLPKAKGGLGWHEVCVRVHGPCIADYRRVFERRWAEAGSVDAGRWVHDGVAYGDVELVIDTPEKRNLVYEKHCDRIAQAKRRVWLENAYFAPPRRFIEALLAAAARGVDVKVIVPKDTDLPLVTHAGRARYASWIERGIEIYEYRPAMVHAKFAVVDDDWATIGTFNANPTSLRWAMEANLIVHRPAFVSEVSALFVSDREKSDLVTQETLASLSRVDTWKDRAARKVLDWVERGAAA
ncbi:MAG: Cardiolipin synthetase [Myxococcaceae bacterium]|nr:Cardiolipin synthetase [Myxococcaceae bacterium]